MLKTITTLDDDKLLTKHLKEKYKGIDIKITNGSIGIYENTNIKKINPIIYKIKYKNIKFNLLYYKCEDIDKKYYLPKEKEEFSLPEIKSYFNKTFS